MSAWLALLLCTSIAEDPSFLEGQRLYRALEYEQAIFRFQEIAVRPALPATDRADVFVWLGLSYAGTGDLEAAQRNFKDALMLNASVALPDNSPPRVKERFDAARSELAPPPPPPPDASPTAPPSDAAPLEPDASAAPEEGSPLFVPGVVAASAGGVALVGGAALAAIAYVSYAAATDPNAFQDEAKASLDRANVGAIAAGIMLPLGAVLGGAGAAMIAISMAAE